MVRGSGHGRLIMNALDGADPEVLHRETARQISYLAGPGLAGSELISLCGSENGTYPACL